MEITHLRVPGRQRGRDKCPAIPQSPHPIPQKLEFGYCLYIPVICFVSISAEFGTCTKCKWEAKMCTFTLESKHFSSTSVPFILTTVQVPNLALVETKRITVYYN